MPNTRAFCDQPDHALVPPIIDVRDNLGNLAIQILAAVGSWAVQLLIGK